MIIRIFARAIIAFWCGSSNIIIAFWCGKLIFIIAFWCVINNETSEIMIIMSRAYCY